MRALITGITGQDGSYLAEHLAAEGVEVIGLIRDMTHPRLEWMRKLVPSAAFVLGDLRDPHSLDRVLETVQPDEIYNLAAVTTPGEGWSAEPTPLVGEVTGLGVVNMLHAILRCAPEARFVQASSSAVHDPGRYGMYGVSKRLAHDAVIGFRRSHGLRASNAIMYSHTSTRQASRYLIRRIVRHVTDVKLGVPTSFVLTNRTNRRDWGHARDYVRALVALARVEQPHDREVRTHLTYSTMAVAALAATHLDVDLSAVTAYWPTTDTSPSLEEAEAAVPQPEPHLDWQPETSFAEIVRELCDYEMWSSRWRPPQT